MKERKSGFVIMAAVLVMAAAIWLILLGQAHLHLNESLINRSWQESQSLAFVSDACLEIAYRGLVLDQFYTGQSLSWGSRSCIITIAKELDDYQIKVSALSNDYYKKIEVEASLNAGQLTINSWREAE